MTIGSCSPGRAGRIVSCHNNQKGGSGNGMEGQEKFAGWAVHFPGNLRWSNAMQIVKGMAPYTAATRDIVDRTCDRLKAREDERVNDSGCNKFRTVAERIACIEQATAAAEGRHITA